MILPLVRHNNKTIAMVMMIIIASMIPFITSFVITNNNNKNNNNSNNKSPDQYHSIPRSSKLMKLQHFDSHSFARQSIFICHSTSKDNNGYDNTNDDNDNNIEEKNHDLDETSSFMSSTNSNLFQDDECYDLCDNINDEHGDNNTKNEDSITVEDYIIPSSSSSSTTSSSSTNTQQQTKEYDPQPNKKTWQNLELKWSITENTDDCDIEDISSCSDPCPHCRGTGYILCQFCGGVGYVDFGFAEKGTVGETLVDHPNGRLGTECPVCNEHGEQKCPTCKGSGWIAKWRLDNPNMSDLRP